MAVTIEKILVVDEVEANLLFFQVLLKELGFANVFAATSGAEALKVAETQNVHFVVAAWEMSAMPGNVFVQKVREDRKRRRIPFMLFSKRMSDNDIKLANELGLKNVLGMPFDRQKAKDTLKAAIDAEINTSPLEMKLRKMEDFIGEGSYLEVLKLVGPDLTKKGPHLPRLKTLLAETWLHLQKFDKAEKSIGEAMALDPNYLPAKYIQARIKSAQGLHDESLAILQSCVTGSPQNMTSLLNLGSAYVDADKLDDAKATLAQVKKMDPESKSANDELGKVAMKQGDVPLAAQLLAQTQNGDALARYFNSMGISLVAKGDFDKGISTYENAMKILSNKAKTYLLKYNLGLAQRKRGDLAKSFTHFCESYFDDPTFEKAYAALVKVSREMKEKGLSVDAEVVKRVKEYRLKHPPANAPTAPSSGSPSPGKQAS